MFFMLAVIFLYVAIGLAISQFGPRERRIVGLVAATMTLIYIAFSNKVL